MTVIMNQTLNERFCYENSSMISRMNWIKIYNPKQYIVNCHVAKNNSMPHDIINVNARLICSEMQSTVAFPSWKFLTIPTYL